MIIHDFKSVILFNYPEHCLSSMLLNMETTPSPMLYKPEEANTKTKIIFQKSLMKSKMHQTSKFTFFFILFLKIFIVIQLQLSAFSPHPSTPPQPNPPPSPASTLPLEFVQVSFIVVPVTPSPHYPFPAPLWLLLDCS